MSKLPLPTTPRSYLQTIELVMSGKNLRTGTGWRAFFFNILQPPLVHMIFLAKINNVFVPVIFFAHQMFLGDPVLVRDFRFPVFL